MSAFSPRLDTVQPTMFIMDSHHERYRKKEVEHNEPARPYHQEHEHYRAAVCHPAGGHCCPVVPGCPEHYRVRCHWRYRHLCRY